MKLRSAPLTRAGWVDYYAQRFGRTGDPQAAALAMWYYLLDLAEADL